VNPKVTVIDDAKNIFFEGCLSVEGYRGVVLRANKVKVTGLDRHGKSISLSAEGWLARIIQHETAHLKGNLYIDTMYRSSFITEKIFSNDWFDAMPNKIAKLIDTNK
jgi:peptide deformylase